MSQFKFTGDDVSSFLKILIELGGVRTVDDTPDKYIRFASDNSQIKLEISDGVIKPLAIYGTKDPETIIVNPFAEGEAETERNKWFYSSTTMIISGYLIKIMNKLLEIGANSKKKKKGKEEDEVDMTAIRLLTKYAADIDDKMIKEFNTITSTARIEEFFCIYYNKSKRETEVKCTLFIPARRKGFPPSSIRKGTWDVLEGLMGEVLGTTDMSKFSYKSTLIGCPIFEGYVTVLCDLYDAIQHALPVIGIKVDTTQVRGHLKYIDQYSALARWCRTPEIPTAPVAQSANPVLPWQMPNVVAPGQVVPPVGMPVPPPMMPMQGPMPGMPFPNVAPIGMQPVVGQMPNTVPNIGYQPIGAMPLQIPGQQQQPTTGADRNNPFARA